MIVAQHRSCIFVLISGFEDVENRRCACIMASGDVILATNLSAVHRYTLPMVSLIGYQKTIPPVFQPKLATAGGGVPMSEKTEKAVKKKEKKARGSMWGWGGGHAKLADLSKIFGDAQQRMEQDAERSRHELGLDSGEEGEEKNSRTHAKNELNETANIMSENMNKLHERGEMINEIQEKTSKMVMNAMLFEQQCKQINKAQEEECTIS